MTRLSLRCLLFATLLVSLSASAALNRWSSGGPHGGVIRSLAIDPSNSSRMYAGTEAGAYRSADGGETWTPFSDGLTTNPNDFLPAVAALTFSFTDPPVLYAGAGKQVFRMTANGTGWISTAPFRSDVGTSQVFSLATDPSNPQTLYVGVDGGVFKTIDGGVNWTGTFNDFSCLSVFAVAVNPVVPSIVYAGTCNGVFKSTDGGTSFQAANTGFTSAAFSLVIDAQTPTTIYTAAQEGVYKSIDSAATWAPMNTGLPAQPLVSRLLADPTNVSILYAATFTGVFVTNDKAVTWSRMGVNTPDRVNALALAGGPFPPLYAGTARGVFRTEDGGVTWVEKNNGIVGRAVGALAIDRASILYTVDATTGAIERSTDLGASWSPAGHDVPSYTNVLVVDPVAPNTVYAGTEDGVFKTTNSGLSWTPGLAGLPPHFNVALLAAGASSPTTLYAVDTRLNFQYKSVDGGVNWFFLGTRPVRVIAVDPGDAATVFTCGPFGCSKSTDGGLSWRDLNNRLTAYVLTLAFDPAHHSTIYAGTLDSGVFKTTDGGESWIAANSGLPATFDLSIRSVAVDPVNPAIVYASTLSSGVYRSVNGGGTWTPFNEGLVSPLVLALAIAPNGHSIHASTLVGVFDRSFGVQHRRAVGK